MIFMAIGATLGVVAFILTLGSPISAVVAGLLGAVLYYLFLPVLSPVFVGIWFLVAVALAAGGAVSRLTGANQRFQRGGIIGLGTAGGLIVVLGVLYLLTTSAVFHAGAYYALLGQVEEVPFEQAVQRLDTSGKEVPDNTVINQRAVIEVDQHIAFRRASELLGSNPAIGSAYELGEFTKTRLNGDGPVVWAAPLDFNGYGPWSSSNGAPGYVWVDAHDSHEAGYVTKLDNGSDVLLHCTPNAYFGDNIQRRLRRQGYAATGLTDYSFEIGPHMRPYYVVTTYAHKVGFGGADPTGVAIMDPQTCQSRYYGIDNVPRWVNRVVPSDMVVDQVRDYGAYAHGWWNAVWSGSDVTAPSVNNNDGVDLVQTTSGGSTAWYVGITTPSRSTGTLGFMLVDSRTKKARLFRQTGTTEFIAQNAVRGQVSQQAGWTASVPILYNVFDRPTYMSIVEDANHTFKGIGLVSVADVNLVVVASDLQGALQAYAARLAGQGPAPGLNTGVPVTVIEGKVKDIASVVRNGGTIFYIVMDNKPGVVFSAPDSVGPQVALTHPGQTIRIQAEGEVNGILSVRKLDNPAVLPPRP